MTDRRFDSGSDIDIAHDEEPRETLVLLQRTQDVVNTVFTSFHGEAPEPLSIDLREVEAALREELDLAGLPEQPEPWVNNTAFEIAAGRHVVIDTRTV